jgi:hypothetical protein
VADNFPPLPGASAVLPPDPPEPSVSPLAPPPPPAPKYSFVNPLLSVEQAGAAKTIESAKVRKALLPSHDMRLFIELPPKRAAGNYPQAQRLNIMDLQIVVEMTLKIERMTGVRIRKLHKRWPDSHSAIVRFG